MEPLFVGIVTEEDGKVWEYSADEIDFVEFKPTVGNLLHQTVVQIIITLSNGAGITKEFIENAEDYEVDDEDED